MRQLPLAFEPGLSHCHRSLREFVATRIYQKGITAVAGKLDVAPTHLTEKLAGKSSDGKRRCMSVDELEKYIETYKDPAPIFYLIDKFLEDPEIRQAEALDKATRLLEQLPGVLAAAGLDANFTKGRR